MSIDSLYRDRARRAGGSWYALVTDLSRPLVDSAAGYVDRPLVDNGADHVVEGYSVQKLAVAVAVLEKVDRGELSLGQLVALTADDILGGSGIYFLQGVWGDQLTLANVLTAMLLVSDNTSVRLCGRLVPAAEINEILAAKGFTRTRVEPVADPHRFRMGTTTPRETVELLRRLVEGTLLSPASSAFMVRVLRWVNGYTDGVRRVMSSAERARVATKHGADFNAAGAARHEAGVVFGRDGAPRITYALFADGLGEVENYGATHPAVEAHAALGRAMMDAVDE
ncbi:serine hydrolase [Actinoplanes sp. TBRC 11911]|uniref:serine hydrolase n=1 Tax=Actinoplanes sp. TBRC 11911 TaxID=2729386 RepID=UPI00145F0B1F|nr:serine hydrolase [Actinoplanes sp. TBRC 11911]NMO51744.1 serine hydrolase [Actinoplanes sp. TBRC 11911]